MQISIQEANAAIGSLDSAYYGVVLKGYYMPTRSCSAITTEFLYKVMTNGVFRIQKSNVKIGQLLSKTTTSKYCWEFFQNIQTEKPWGFDSEHLLDKMWMINVLYTLSPNHELFENYPSVSQSILTQEDLKVIQTFNTSFGRQSQGRFFKRSKLQSNAHKKQQELQKKKVRKTKQKKSKDKLKT